MRSDYTTLEMTVAEDFSPQFLLTEFGRGAYDGICLRTSRGFKLADVAFLKNCRGLRYLELNGKIGTDLDAFDIPGIEELVLLTRCRRRLPEVISNTLSSLSFDYRPGVENVANAHSLVSLGIWGFERTELGFLSEMHGLVSLRLEANNQIMSLSGLEGLGSLETIEIEDVAVEDLKPLRRLTALKRLLIIGAIDIGAHDVLDLEDLRGAEKLETLTLTYGGYVKSVRPLLSLKSLNIVRLRGTVVLDGDLSPLEALRPTLLALTGPDE